MATEVKPWLSAPDSPWKLVRAVRKAVGPDFPISLRVSQWKLQDYAAKLATTPQEMEAWLLPLAEAGVDLFHCSQRRFWDPEFTGSDLNFAGWAKKLTGKSDHHGGLRRAFRRFPGRLSGRNFKAPLAR